MRDRASENIVTPGKPALAQRLTAPFVFPACCYRDNFYPYRKVAYRGAMEGIFLFLRPSGISSRKLGDNVSHSFITWSV